MCSSACVCRVRVLWALCGLRDAPGQHPGDRPRQQARLNPQPTRPPTCNSPAHVVALRRSIAAGTADPSGPAWPGATGNANLVCEPNTVTSAE